jgi:hypothetical protein
MNSKLKIGLGIAGTVVAIGAAVGVGATAAGLTSGSQDASGPVAGYGQGDGRSGEGRGGFDSTELAASLATKLGVDQDKVEAALKEVMAANQPSGQPSGMPSGGASAMPSGNPSAAPSGQPDGQGGPGGGGANLETMAKSLAEKLDLDEAKVLAALQEVMGNRGGGNGQPSASPTSQ